jgi:hypothetical protein
MQQLEEFFLFGFEVKRQNRERNSKIRQIKTSAVKVLDNNFLKVSIIYTLTCLV